MGFINLYRIQILALTFLGVGQSFSWAAEKNPCAALNRVSGFYTGASIAKEISQYPDFQSHLIYIDLDQADSPTLRNHAKGLEETLRLLEKNSRPVALQIALETSKSSLPRILRALELKDHPLANRLDLILDRLRHSRNLCIFLRPFSEMNDGSAQAPWELNTEINDEHPNSPDRFIEIWQQIFKRIKKLNSPNLKMMFSPLATRQRFSIGDISYILNQLPQGSIHIYAPTLYSRPRSYYGEDSFGYDSLRNLLDPWIRVLRNSPHADVPIGIAELGFWKQKRPEQQFGAFREGLVQAKEMGVKYLMYFQYGARNRGWSISGDESIHRKFLDALKSFQN